MPTGANAIIGLSASRESRSSAPDDMATTLRWKPKALRGPGWLDDSGEIKPRSARSGAINGAASNTAMMTRVTTILSIQSSVATGMFGNSAVKFTAG